MMDLQDYLTGARKIILKYARGESRDRLIASEDAVNAVAEGMMQGDWHWDPATKVPLKVYRVKRGIWALMDYQKRLKNRQAVATVSLDPDPVGDDDGRTALSRVLVDPKDRSPLERLIAHEEAWENHVYVRSLTASLNPSQRRCVIMHCIYDMPLPEISQQLGLSYSYTRHLYQDAMRIMRQEAGVL